MSLSPEFIAKARALAFYRKFKVLRARREGAPEWMWPIIGMRGALGMCVDLHSGNVMMDVDTGEYIMTDPFSVVE